MIKKIITFFSVLTMLTSCGPSAEEIAKREKEKQDSIIIATEEATRNKIEREKQIADSLANSQVLSKKKDYLKELIKKELSNLEIELKLAKDDLREIDSFQLLRTYDEKQAQKKRQMQRIADTEFAIEKTKNNLTEIEEGRVPEDYKEFFQNIVLN